MKLIGMVLTLIVLASTTSAESHFCRDNIETVIVEAAHAEHIDPRTLAALCYRESNFHPTKIHHQDGATDSYGLCQVKYELAKGLGYHGTAQGLLRPEVNARIAAKALFYHQRRTHGYEEMLAAYNAGRVRRKAGVIRNIKYVRSVEANMHRFDNLETL